MSNSNTLTENSPVEPRLSEKAQALIDDIQRAQSLDQRVIVSRRVAQAMLSIGQTRLLELEKLGLLHSLLDGSSRRITTASVYNYLIARAVASHPSDGVEEKVRLPSNMKRKAPKPRRRPTENELAGLAAANLKRHHDAEVSRKANSIPAAE